MSGARPKRKGSRIVRAVVALHRSIGIPAERTPLSGGAYYRGEGHDVDVYAYGRAIAPLRSEVKSRRNGQGFKQLEAWLGSNDLLFLHRNRNTPLVVLNWPTWSALLVDLQRK